MARSPADYHVTMTPRGIYFPEMRKEDVRSDEIAHCLSMVCRYNGFVKKFYSVAEHSVMVCELAEYFYGEGSELARCALLHDAGEAYIGDISRPLKKLLPDYMALELHIDGCVRSRFHLSQDPEIWSAVTKMDVEALHVEANGLLFHRYPWVRDVSSEILAHVVSARNVWNGIVMPPPLAKLAMRNKMEKYGVWNA